MKLNLTSVNVDRNKDDVNVSQKYNVLNYLEIELLRQQVGLIAITTTLKVVSSFWISCR